MTVDETITRDLMAKVASDITAAMIRTIDLVEAKGRLPVSISAGAACIGVIAAILNNGMGERGHAPDPDCVLLAALLVGRTSIGGDDPIGDAYRDLETLKAQALSENGHG